MKPSNLEPEARLEVSASQEGSAEFLESRIAIRSGARANCDLNQSET
jgi:hypothetical protein